MVMPSGARWQAARTSRVLYEPCRRLPEIPRTSMSLPPVVDVPLVGGTDALAQVDPGRPAERGQPGDVEQLARRAVRLGAVPLDRTVISDHVRHQLDQLGDGDVPADPDVDRV